LEFTEQFSDLSFGFLILEPAAGEICGGIPFVLAVWVIEVSVAKQLQNYSLQGLIAGAVDNLGFVTAEALDVPDNVVDVVNVGSLDYALGLDLLFELLA